MRSLSVLFAVFLAGAVSAAAVLPEVTVTVAASDATAAEPASTGKFTIKRVGDLTAALSVNVASSGTATSGVDYKAIPSPIVIPAGKASVTITVTPIDDADLEPLESIILTVLPGD